jgi:tRNA threonylcarbamoyladenosine biosynthesis protein TsaB
MLLLALDTSTRYSSVALCTETELLSEYSWFSGNNHSTELLGYVQRATAEHHLTLQQLDAVAVATGPGSFNGVRVALTAAKSLAFATNKPLVGISTLDVIAAQQRHWQGLCCAVLEAGRSELYAAFYRVGTVRDQGGELLFQQERLSDYLLFSPQQLVTYLREHEESWFATDHHETQPPVLFCGEIHVASRQALQAQLPEQCVFMRPIDAARHAEMLALLAVPRVREHRVDSPFELEPLYLRRPSITKSTRKQPLLGGASQQPMGQEKTEREEGALRH